MPATTSRRRRRSSGTAATRSPPRAPAMHSTREYTLPPAPSRPASSISSSGLRRSGGLFCVRIAPSSPRPHSRSGWGGGFFAFGAARRAWQAGQRGSTMAPPRAPTQQRRQVNTNGKHALGRCERTRAIIRWRCTTYGSATLACYTRDGRTRRCRRHVTSAGAARRARASWPVAHSGCRVGVRTIIVYYGRRACAASPMR